MKQFIQNEKINSWINDLLKDFTVLAPVIKKDLVLFRPIANANEISFDYCNSILSPKNWFFPTSQILFKLDKSAKVKTIEPVKAAENTIIFGIRPCDAKGISLLDVPMNKDPKDTIYMDRRDKTILIGLSCQKSQPACFCTSMDCSPDDTKNVDILLTKVDDGYIVQSVTEKGNKILPKNISSTSQDLPKPPDVPKLKTEGLIQIMKKFFNNPYWEKLADRCLHCNICASVCPTCYCFDIRDYTDNNRVERIRSQESCQATCFTKIAGGADHRTTKGSRLRQRFFHKFLYFSEQFDQDIDCTGCGRCVTSCPVNIDIREIIQDLQMLEAKSGS